jgi:hypothetical protein
MQFGDRVLPTAGWYHPAVGSTRNVYVYVYVDVYWM